MTLRVSTVGVEEMMTRGGRRGWTLPLKSRACEHDPAKVSSDVTRTSRREGVLALRNRRHRVTGLLELDADAAQRCLIRPWSRWVAGQGGNVRARNGADGNQCSPTRRSARASRRRPNVIIMIFCGLFIQFYVFPSLTDPNE